MEYFFFTKVKPCGIVGKNKKRKEQVYERRKRSPAEWAVPFRV